MQSVEELKEQYDTFQDEVREIDEVITGAVTGDPSIGATSDSKTANWRLIRMVWTAMSFLQQQIFELFKLEVEEIARNSPKMTDTWLREEVKIFQYGDALQWDRDTREYFYEEIDEDKQIIDRVAVVPQAGLSTIKVAKAGPQALTADELSAFTAFVRLIQPTGSNISVLSQDSDKIHLPIEVIYDPLIPKSQVKSDVEEAINSYLSSLSFNGTFYTITLVDFIQAVEGVVDVIPGGLEAWASQDDPFSSGPFDRKYLPVSGYIEIYDGSPLNDIITYTPING